MERELTDLFERILGELGHPVTSLEQALIKREVAKYMQRPDAIPDGELIEYDQYFDRCEAANRTPLTFTQWQKAKAW